MARLREVAPRLGRAWDEYREEHWRAAVCCAARFRADGESLEVARHRVYLEAMAHNLRRRDRLPVMPSDGEDQ